MRTLHMNIYSRGSDLKRNFKEYSKPCPQINKMVLSYFKNISEIVYQRYYKERKYPLPLLVKLCLQVLNLVTPVNIKLRKTQIYWRGYNRNSKNHC